MRNRLLSICAAALAATLAACAPATERGHDDPSDTAEAIQIVGPKAPGAFAHAPLPGPLEAVPDWNAQLASPVVASLEAVRLRHRDRGVRVGSIDTRTGLPTILWADSKSSSSRADHATIDHIRALADVYQLDDAALESIHVDHVHDTGRGAIVVRAVQRVGGLNVFGTAINAVMNREHQLIALSGNLHPSASAQLKFAGLTSSPADALDLAIGDATAGPVSVLTQRVRPVLFPTAKSLELAHHVEFEAAPAGSATSRAYGYVVADDGRILARINRTVSDAYEYRVWADPVAPFTPQDSPMGDTSPSPSQTPGGPEAPYVAQSLISIEGFNTNPDGVADPWLADDATVTTGNNVDAYADHANPDGFGAGDLRAELTAAGVFDYTFDPAADPIAVESQSKATIVQMFYTINWLHDYFYDSGFNEGARVAQTDNFDRGGEAGDVLRAEAQDTAGVQRNNANMSTPPDGISPRMQMFLWDIAPGVDRDSSVDNAIIAHEWGHYFHHRLSFCNGTTQCRSMSEGWGDYLAVMMMVRDGDDLEATYGVSHYAFGDPYFGIRRVPYSTRFDRNALTFRHMSDGQALPVGEHPISDNGIRNSEVHNAGEIWTMALVEVYFALINDDRHTFAQAQRRMADYIVAGLLASPVDGTVTEVRDSILAAAAAADIEDMIVMAEAFARRGLGTGAVSPDRASVDLTGITESFEIAGELTMGNIAAATAGVCDDDVNWDAGEEASVEIVVNNRGPLALSNTAVTISADSAAVTFPDGETAEIAAVEPYGEATLSVKALLDRELAGIQTVNFTVTATNADSVNAEVTGALSQRVNFDDLTASSATDDVESSTVVWTSETDVALFEWARNDETGNTVWFGADPGSIADQRLLSPPLEVGNGDFSITFAHRHSFEESGGTFWDGGVVEISSDGGTTFVEVPLPYGGILSTEADNPLGGRNAFVGQSVGYPAMVTTSADLGTQFAGQTVLVRFRIGSDAAVSDIGWELDNLEFGGINNTPFASIGDDQGECAEPEPEPEPEPTPEDGGCGCQSGGTGGAGGGLLLLGMVLIAVGRRRRSATR